MNSGGTLAGGAGSTLGNAVTFTSGANTLNLGGTITGNVAIQTGTLQINAAAGGSTLTNPITGAGGLIQSSANTLTLSGANTYSGGTALNGGTLQLGTTGAAGTGAITFGTLTGNATAQLGLSVAAQPASGGTFTNTLANFNTTSQLNLAGLTNATVSYNSANTSITVTGTRTGGGQVSENFVLSAPRTTSFTATNDGAGNTIIRAVTPTNPTPPANNAPCYCTGTCILTVRGEVAVEDLRIGDIVVTAAGAHRPIRWIGTRGYSARFADTNPALLPVRVHAGALDDGVPARALWVSPDHALYLDRLLVPAGLLVNGASITKAGRMEEATGTDSLTYWHVELDGHDVLVAEGAPAESFVDDGGRGVFHNAASYRALYPHTPSQPAPAVYCAPRITDDGRHGHALEAIRRRLALRAGLAVAPARVFGELRGHLDLCALAGGGTRHGGAGGGTLRVAGWARDLAYPDGPVCLDVVVDGVVAGLAYAETYRPDLAAAGLGHGRHAFDLTLALPPARSAPRSVTVRRAADGAVIGTARIGTDGAEGGALAA